MRSLLLACLCLLPFASQAQDKGALPAAHFDTLQACVPQISSIVSQALDQEEDSDQVVGLSVMFCQCELEKVPLSPTQSDINHAEAVCADEVEDLGWDGFADRWNADSTATVEAMQAAKLRGEL